MPQNQFTTSYVTSVTALTPDMSNDIFNHSTLCQLRMSYFEYV